MTLTPFQRFLAGTGVAVLVVAAILGYVYLNNEARKATLEKQLATLQATVDKINQANTAGDLTDPLLTTPAFPANPPNLDLATIVLNSAAQSGVTTGPLQATTQGTEKVGNNTYRTVSMNLTISGSLPEILDFFDRVERGGIRTLVFDNIQVDPSSDHWIAQMQLIVYAQPG
jgi:hypothetical protein